MKICTRKTSAAGIPSWMPLLLLLCSSLVDLVVSTTVTSAIDASGEIENLTADGTNDDNDNSKDISTKSKKTPLDFANAQFDWLISKGGSVNREKVAIRPVSGEGNGNGNGKSDEEAGNSSNNLGLFAVNDIVKGDLLMEIPTSVILKGESSSSVCDAAWTLLHEVTKKGSESDFAPYLNYLYGSEEVPSIPSTWSSAGKNLLKKIQGPELIPQDITEASFFEDCIEEEDDDLITNITEDKKVQFETAYTIAITRSWEDKMVPFLDMFNHHPRSNIVTKAGIGDDEVSRFIMIFAKTDVRKGDQLYINYRQRKRDFEYHLSILLQVFGFVEDYPQRWTLPTPEKRSNIEENKIPPEILFDIHKVANEDSDVYGVRWIDPEGPLQHPAAAEHLNKELARIEEIEASVMETAATLASVTERKVILDYYRSLVIAYETVIASVEEAIELSPGTVDNEGDNFMACSDFHAIHDGTFGWEGSQESASSHQSVEYYYNPDTRDACLFLEEYLHACVSNRPHYHEVFVHYPARYLEKVERVLFIGGGDSMVLHEVLKYDDQLELVVGLELDQHVVRSTYAKIGTQPHFDNDKVEWWFGDAAEALNVLPTDYYGTFDLVVVDILSEVAESLQVTDEVTIMEAAMMLMKPTGIIVKNEDEGYVPGSTNSNTFTDHTVDVMYYDVPVYCLQTFVIGSNAVDFSATKPTDHKVSNFYLKGVDEFQAQFDTWHTSGKETKNASDGENKKDEETEKGVDDSELESNTSALTIIIDTEQISVPMSMDSASSIQEIIHECVKLVGFTVKKSFINDLIGGYSLISVLEEGAINARCFPEKKYCAIDVQLWKSAHKAESMKKEILLGLKSEENSVYRVITTGVFGVEENNNNSKIGPPPKKTVPSPGSTLQDDSGDSESVSGIHTSFTKRENIEIDFKNATMEDYDSSSALAQWHSQEPLGIQTIVKYHLPFSYTLEKFEEMMDDVLYDAIEGVLEAFEDKSKSQIVFEGVAIGKGLVVVVTWSEGSLIGLWDGHEKFNMNIFSLERSARASQGSVAVTLREYMTMTSADLFSRGTGRVINTRRDFTRKDGTRFHPFWALELPETEGDDVGKR